MEYFKAKHQPNLSKILISLNNMICSPYIILSTETIVVLSCQFKDTIENVLFLLVPCCTGEMVRYSYSIVEPLFLFFLSIVLYRQPHLCIVHPPPIFSYPSSRSPPISTVASPFFCFIGVFQPLLSLLVCMHPSMVSNPHYVCLPQANSQSMLLEHPLP